MKHCPSLLFLFLPILVSQSFARVGETEDQIAARYDKPVKTEAGLDERHIKRIYSFRGIKVIVHFFGGKSHHEMFRKEEPGELSETEIQTLLQANQFTGKWVEIGESEGSRRWRLKMGNNPPKKETGDLVADIIKQMADDDSGALYADYDTHAHLLGIGTPAFLKWYHETVRAAKKKNLEGF